MKNDTLYDYVKSQLEKGISEDELFDILSKAGNDYNKEQEKKAKEEEQKKLKEEVKKRKAEDVYNAYVEYFGFIYPSKELPKDSKKLFNAELDFIDYMMSGEAKEKAKEIDDLVTKIFKGFI